MVEKLQMNDASMKDASFKHFNFDTDLSNEDELLRLLDYSKDDVVY